MTTLAANQSGVALDIFVKAGSVLYDPAVITFQVVDANGAVQGSGVNGEYYGYKTSVGHYNAGLFTVPSSGAVGSWTITWTVDAATKNETFTVAAPTLTTAGDAPNILDVIYDRIRIDIGDINGDIFTDALLERYTGKAVARLNRALGISRKVRPIGITPGGLGTPAKIPSIAIDFDQRTLYPENDEISDIIVLQSEVLITKAEMAVLRRAGASSAGSPGAELLTATSGITSGNEGEGIMVRNADGVTVDTRQRFNAWSAQRVKLFLDEAKMREKELADAIRQLRLDFAGSMGKVIY
jgi:hypothetical protein